MTNPTPVLLPEKGTVSYASRTLNLAAAFWLTVATVGQWLFGIYILLFYGKSAVTGDFQRWNTVLPHGYTEGDWKGNLVVAIYCWHPYW